jgi:ubiquinone/menaquinone biosynthesis C-methylase UbiE
MGKWFSRLYDPAMAPLEKHFLHELRERLVGKAYGNVLEIGSGTGLNFPIYKQVEKVVAIEPNLFMREKSLLRAKGAEVQIEVVAGDAGNLPFANDVFDTAICTLVICTVPDPNQVLQELRRVVKPGGVVLFIEHVRFTGSGLGHLQDWLTPLWRHLCDGCYLNRNTLDLVKSAGFKVIHIERFIRGLVLHMEVINRK